MKVFRDFFGNIFAPLYSRFLFLVAYGPWGKVHQISIRVFQKLYKIEWNSSEYFPTLGDFFLRNTSIPSRPETLVSPAEARVLEGPRAIEMSSQIRVKGISYAWLRFPELDPVRMKNATLWNMYLAPHNYHWVHSPADGTNLEAYRFSGKKWPVNGLGRWLCPALYSENERLTFKFESPEYGQILLFCVGAMGVSAMKSAKGPVPYGRWTSLGSTVKKSERLLGFQLGSTVLMLIERPPASPRALEMVRVGDALY